MKSKAPLLLMEQMVMLLVFAFAAALCLQAFVKSDGISRRSENRDRALQEAQSAAEVIQYTKGNFEQAAELLGTSLQGDGSLTIFYENDWTRSEPSSPGVYPFGYSLGTSRIDSGVPGLGKAGVWVQEDESGEELIRIEVAWQEVDGDGD